MKISHTILNRKIVVTDYIPLQVRTEKECQETDYFYAKKDDRSLLELSFDKNDSTIHRIALLICKDYEKTNENYQIPSNYESGDVLVESAGEIESSIFRSIIYSNAVKVVVSNEVPDSCILSGNVVWELNGCGELVSLCVIDSTGITSEHCRKELEANCNVL